MRDHPIQPVTELLQYRAIGLVRGVYVPEDPEHFSRGVIVDGNGEKIESVVLGRALGLIKKRLSAEDPHLWVVYPRCRDSEHLHLQISGIWEPSTLDRSAKNNLKEDSNKNKTVDEVKEGDDYFSIRGELIFTKPEAKEIVLKIRQKRKKKGKKSSPFKLSLKGEVSIEYLRNFVSLDVRRSGQMLCIEDAEIIAPIQYKRKGK
ncbi:MULTISPECIES: hypothetical protein [unclassified Prochlorococcus]|uniref:hypothetical protein n=1 Tax=unclassified Prochlorococcus TaxID=2627481 RepID=UPI0005339DDB|nr:MULTISPECIES: hypothetical protein [unclassified Prochlorococcus]KGG16473.1 hypothetical protein EV06_0311 [Prochlorococcus sp. MIT 0602]KGG17052.1 hypothetical protein EV07_0482 [Prochlorococcus sp. MIT 0603]